MNFFSKSVLGPSRLLFCMVVATKFLGLSCHAQEMAHQVGEDSSAQQTTVGMPGKLDDLILPGSPLEVIPAERNAAMVVRILQTIGHGENQNRYEIEYYCLEPGDYNLADYLQRIDGSTSDDLPAIPVSIKSQLPSGQVKPHELIARKTPRVGGYKNLLMVGGVVWVLGLLWLLFGGRKKLTEEEVAEKQASLADRLRPLVESAMNGDLDDARQAELERMLLTYWRGKLGLNEASAAEAITELRNHETAGELLRHLESWLHMPADRRQQVDVGKLLEPYRNLSATDNPGIVTSVGGQA